MLWGFQQASKDVLALANVEVDISAIPIGSTVTIKWRGKPVFIRHRTEVSPLKSNFIVFYSRRLRISALILLRWYNLLQDEIKKEAEVSVGSLRDPQSDAERAVDPEVRRTTHSTNSFVTNKCLSFLLLCFFLTCVHVTVSFIK